MAKRTIVVSDLNGEEVVQEQSATITVSWFGREMQRVLEVTATEADELFGQAGVERKKRGRKGSDDAATNGAAGTTNEAETSAAKSKAK